MDSDKQSSNAGEQTRQADMYDLLAWFEVNKKKLAVVALLAVIVGFAIVTLRHFRQQKELRASDALLQLKATLVTPTNATPVQASALQKVAQDFNGTSAGERAQYLAAAALFSEGKYAEAETAFNKFLSENSGSPWAGGAAYGAAAAQEAQKKDALAAYQSVVTRFPNSAVADDAKLAMARIYESRNQPDQALRLYNELSAPPPGASTGMPGNQLAAERKDELLRKHPQLDTNRLAEASAPANPIPAPGANNPPTLSLPAAPSEGAQTPQAPPAAPAETPAPQPQAEPVQPQPQP